MNPAKLILSDEIRKKLTMLRKDKKLPCQTAKRLEVIWLMDRGCTTAMIAQQLNIRKELVRKYHAEFLKGGLSLLLRLEKPGRETLLTEERFQALEAYMKQIKKKYSLKDLTAFLLQTYGISISEEWLSKRLTMRKLALKRA